jgi:hypothetical protein
MEDMMTGFKRRERLCSIYIIDNINFHFNLSPDNFTTKVLNEKHRNVYSSLNKQVAKKPE